VALNRALRLRKNRNFQQVRQQGRSISSRLLVLAWMPNDLARMRIGIVVSKRISKHAVTRNYIKRLLSDAIRASLQELSGGWDVIFSVRSSILTADLPMLQQDVRMLLRRARLLAPSQTPEARS
jgi:ribonuclease P protein component